jgi:hypothetical protein
VDAFVDDLGIQEDNADKRSKIELLKLSDEEWERVGKFCSLLGVSPPSKSNCFTTTNIYLTKQADKAQQAFSSHNAPTMHNALPAIEALHSAWDSRSQKPRYKAFAPALNSATKKLDGYYQKTAESDSHIMAMC